ncbi:hypothetical protein CA13_35530 [Planctomycetes bacterium CA13]|uniref:Uncharacterized protein n=1 Tax=Novipirellula herctigrandis TaxID=2527986 RepID=A0A5C5Z685_9BACT|nr:hypothetical protein CA13_35530 [Planctomycetes bacterium CA13]
MSVGVFVCPAKLANPAGACHRPSPVHGELNPNRKGSVGDCGFEGSDRKNGVRSENEPDTAACSDELARSGNVRFMNKSNTC